MTVKVLLALLVAASVALQVTVVAVPAAKVDPEAGAQPTGRAAVDEVGGGRGRQVTTVPPGAVGGDVHVIGHAADGRAPSCRRR